METTAQTTAKTMELLNELTKRLERVETISNAAVTNRQLLERLLARLESGAGLAPGRHGQEGKDAER